MVKQGIYTIRDNRLIARDVYRMVLDGDTSALTDPGQFVNIKIEGLYLRRPISVCSYGAGSMTLVYKILGKGTAKMAAMQPGETLDLLVGLGNGFDVGPALGKRIALVGGGVGIPPLYSLMEALYGERVICVMGFRSAEDIFYEQEFFSLGARVIVTTEDGSTGRKGLVTDVLRDLPYDYYFACGPQGMLQAVHALGKQGQLSFEERMACGFGACMGCSCKTITGYKRICADGPVLMSEEVTFA